MSYELRRVQLITHNSYLRLVSLPPTREYSMTDPRWLAWTRRIAALAQNGLAYTEGPFDRERYEELRKIAVEMMGAYADAAPERIAELFAAEDGYATPKVDVRGIVFREGRILLVRER